MVSTEEINDLLPQTQCRLCGYENCRAYARGIIKDGASIDLCPPGGESTRIKLASVMNIQLTSDRVLLHSPRKRLASVRESDCIGCAKCLIECPTDAIIGAKSMIHTVVENWCTGCGLCVPVCPVDCIELKVESDGVSTLSPSEARLRYEHHLNRLKIKSKNKPEQTYITFDKGSKEEMRDIIKAAIGRKKMKKVC